MFPIGPESEHAAMICYQGTFLPQGYVAPKQPKHKTKGGNGAERRIRGKRCIEWLHNNITENQISYSQNWKEYKVAQQVVAAFHFPEVELPPPTKLTTAMAIECATAPFKSQFGRFYTKGDEKVEVYRFTPPEMPVHGGALSALRKKLDNDRQEGPLHTLADDVQESLLGVRRSCPINTETPLNYFTATTHAACYPDELLFEMFDNRNAGRQAASSTAKPPKPRYSCDFHLGKFEVTSTCAPSGLLSDTLISYLKHTGMADLRES